MKRNKPIMFKNRWKLYSHIMRSSRRNPTIEDFIQFLKPNIPAPDLETYKRLSLPDKPYVSETRETPIWQLVIDEIKLSNESLHLLTEEMKHKVDGADGEAIYNQMIRHKWEMARLAEMLQVENFRYQFLRQTLHNLYSKKRIVPDVMEYHGGKYSRRIAQSWKEEKQRQEKQKYFTNTLDAMEQLVKAGGSSQMNLEQRKSMMKAIKDFEKGLKVK